MQKKLIGENDILQDIFHKTPFSTLGTFTTIPKIELQIWNFLSKSLENIKIKCYNGYVVLKRKSLHFRKANPVTDKRFKEKFL